MLCNCPRFSYSDPRCPCEQFREKGVAESNDKYVKAVSDYEPLPDTPMNNMLSKRPKLKMQLILIGESSLCVKVEEVDARWSDYHHDNEARVYRARNYFNIEYASFPEMYIDCGILHLSASVNKECTRAFELASDRTKWIADVEFALKEWSEHWAGFKTCSPSCTNHCPPPQPARMEKRESESALVYYREDAKGTGAEIEQPNLKVIHYTVY